MNEFVLLGVIIFILVLVLGILKIVLPMLHRYLKKFSWYRGFISPFKIYFKGIKDVTEECDSLIILIPYVFLIYNIAFCIALIRNLFKGGDE